MTLDGNIGGMTDSWLRAYCEQLRGTVHVLNLHAIMCFVLVSSLSCVPSYGGELCLRVFGQVLAFSNTQSTIALKLSLFLTAAASCCVWCTKNDLALVLDPPWDGAVARARPFRP